MVIDVLTWRRAWPQNFILLSGAPHTWKFAGITWSNAFSCLENQVTHAFLNLAEFVTLQSEGKSTIPAVIICCFVNTQSKSPLHPSDKFMIYSSPLCALDERDSFHLNIYAMLAYIIVFKITYIVKSSLDSFSDNFSDIAAKFSGSLATLSSFSDTPWKVGSIVHERLIYLTCHATTPETANKGMMKQIKSCLVCQLLIIIDSSCMQWTN